MDVRELFNAYKLQRKRKISEKEPEIEREQQPCFVSQHLTETAATTTASLLDESVKGDIAKETDEVIQLKVKYHIKRLRLSTRQVLNEKLKT